MVHKEGLGVRLTQIFLGSVFDVKAKKEKVQKCLYQMQYVGQAEAGGGSSVMNEKCHRDTRAEAVSRGKRAICIKTRGGRQSSQHHCGCRSSTRLY